MTAGRAKMNREEEWQLSVSNEPQSEIKGIFWLFHSRRLSPHLETRPTIKRRAPLELTTDAKNEDRMHKNVTFRPGISDETARKAYTEIQLRAKNLTGQPKNGIV